MKKLFDGALIITIVTALLYCWSTARYNGFLHAANLDPDMMERNFHQVIYSGLVISFKYLLLFLIAVTLAWMFYAHVILLLYVDWVRGSYRSKRRVVKFRYFWSGKRMDSDLEKREKKRFNSYAVILFSGLFFVASLSFFEQQGIASARSLLERYKQDSDHSLDLISVEIGGGEKNFLFLGCGARNCAGLTPNTSRIFYFDQSIGYSYLYENTSAAQ